MHRKVEIHPRKRPYVEELGKSLRWFQRMGVGEGIKAEWRRTYCMGWPSATCCKKVFISVKIAAQRIIVIDELFGKATALVGHGTPGRLRGNTRPRRTAARECLAAEGLWPACIGACIGDCTAEEDADVRAVCGQLGRCTHSTHSTVQAQRLSALALHIPRGTELLALAAGKGSSPGLSKLLKPWVFWGDCRCLGWLLQPSWVGLGWIALTRRWDTRVKGLQVHRTRV